MFIERIDSKENDYYYIVLSNHHTEIDNFFSFLILIKRK